MVALTTISFYTTLNTCAGVEEQPLGVGSVPLESRYVAQLGHGLHTQRAYAVYVPGHGKEAGLTCLESYGLKAQGWRSPCYKHGH